MGGRNVILVHEQWYGLPDRPFRVLTYMAARSIDGADPPVYRAGWEKLAMAASRPVPPKDDVDQAAIRARRAGLKAVNGYVGSLLDLGAIKVVERAAPGRNTVYALMIIDKTVHVLGVNQSDDDPRWNGSQLLAGRFTVTRQSVHAQDVNQRSTRSKKQSKLARAIAIVMDQSDATEAEAREVLERIQASKAAAGDPVRDIEAFAPALTAAEIGAELKAVRDVGKAERLATAPRCPRHPTEVASFCRQCRSERIGAA